MISFTTSDFWPAVGIDGVPGGDEVHLLQAVSWSVLRPIKDMGRFGTLVWVWD